jgi:hypothetical protein
MKNSLSPFNHRKLIFEAVVCSYKLPWFCHIIENAFGILAFCFRILVMGIKISNI